MCGVVGIYNQDEASTLAYLALYAQQHRGQESAGIVTSDSVQLTAHHAMGLVADIFNQNVLARLPGKSAIGHVRYSTAGGSFLKNCQPFSVNYAHGSFAIGHNGNIVNAPELKQKFEKQGAIFRSSSDTETIIHALARAKGATDLDRLMEVLPGLQGAFSLVLLTPDRLYAVRDPWGFRPLVIGKRGDGFVVTSETCALDLLQAEYVREVEPGEIVSFGPEGMSSHKFVDDKVINPKRCIFEYVYFARPDSRLYGRDVYEVRKDFGRALARQNPVEADLVVPVPDSGTPAAIGYAQECGLPFELGLVRNHYVGRTFIEPEQSIRHFGVKVKLNPVPEALKGKRIILVDDSIVRGTTSQKIIRMVRDAGAKEVHLRISSPPTSWPCFYGIDTPSRRELISAVKSLEEIRQFIQADTLDYLSNEGLYGFLGKDNHGEGFCDACFTGKYPVSAETIAKRLGGESGSLAVSA